jgi:hypothetical protein
MTIESLPPCRLRSIPTYNRLWAPLSLPEVIEEKAYREPTTGIPEINFCIYQLTSIHDVVRNTKSDHTLRRAKAQWRQLTQMDTNMTQLLRSKGLLGYVNGKIPRPTQPTSTTTSPDPTPVYSTTPSPDEWDFCDLLARGHITLNCMDIASLGIKATGTSKEAWDSIQAEWGKSTNMRQSHAQELLNQTIYVEGDIQDHIKLLRTHRAAIDNLSTSAMMDETWRGIIIRSIPPTAKWLPIIPSLYTMTSSSDIISTLLAHGMILTRGTQTKLTSGSSGTVLAARATNRCTNSNCKAKKCSIHTTTNCYWPGGGKEGQFPPNFGQRTRANAITSTHNEIEHFVLSVRVPDTPGNSGVIIGKDESLGGNNISAVALISKSFKYFGGEAIPTFMDSGASDMMFVSWEVFIEYKEISSHTGDSAKAVDGDFEIVGEEKVVQQYLVDGKEKEITYMRALHMPALNTNISISSFDRAGMRTTFGDGCGVIRKRDGTVVLTG